MDFRVREIILAFRSAMDNMVGAILGELEKWSEADSAFVRSIPNRNIHQSTLKTLLASDFLQDSIFEAASKSQKTCGGFTCNVKVARKFRGFISKSNKIQETVDNINKFLSVHNVKNWQVERPSKQIYNKPDALGAWVDIQLQMAEWYRQKKINIGDLDLRPVDAKSNDKRLDDVTFRLDNQEQWLLRGWESSVADLSGNGVVGQIFPLRRRVYQVSKDLMVSYPTGLYRAESQNQNAAMAGA